MSIILFDKYYKYEMLYNKRKKLNKNSRRMKRLGHGVLHIMKVCALRKRI